jgi:hypothetical protein
VKFGGEVLVMIKKWLRNSPPPPLVRVFSVHNEADASLPIGGQCGIVVRLGLCLCNEESESYFQSPRFDRSCWLYIGPRRARINRFIFSCGSHLQMKL